MTKKVLTTPVSDADIESLKIGDVFYLSGALITSRDMVHFRHVEEGMDLPYDLAGKAIFHAGPIMVPDDKSRSGFRVVSIGPTTSMRMEKYEIENWNREHDPRPQAKARRKKIDRICGAIMLVATILFLAVGFGWMALVNDYKNYLGWRWGWIVYPIAGVLCALVSHLMDDGDGDEEE